MNVRPQEMCTILTLIGKSTVAKPDVVSIKEEFATPHPPKIINFYVCGQNGIMKGTAEATVTIEIIQANKIIAKVFTSSKGTFVVKLPKPCKGINVYILYVINKEGKKSDLVKHSIKIN